MSLVSLVLRIATARALRDATFAGKRVHDSMIDPASLLEEEAEPFIVVAVDSAESSPTGRDLLCAAGQTQLTLDLGVASKVRVKRPGAGEDDPPAYLGIPHTDAGMEVTLDLMMRQIARVLMASQGPWACLWRTIVTNIPKAQADRGAAGDEGVRFATRQFILTLNTIAEPSFGDAVGVWKTAITLMKGDADLVGIAELLEVEIENPSLDGWARAVADLGLRDSASLGGEALLEGTPEALTDATLKFEGGAWGATAETIEDALGPDPNETEHP